LVSGFSDYGKSTLAHTLEEKLFQKSGRTFVLDGNNVRHGLNSNLDFSGGREDRKYSPNE